MTSRRIGWAIAFSALLLAGCAVQRIRSSAEEQMAAGHYEAAVRLLEDGYKAHPDSVELRSALLQARQDAINRVLAEAAGARAQGRGDAAAATVARARLLDPDNLRVREMAQLLDADGRQRLALERAADLQGKGQFAEALRTVTEALKENPRHAQLQDLQRDLERRLRDSRVGGARPLAEARPISLDFRDANLRTVLDLVSRNSGINFVIDKEVRSDLRITVYLRNASVEEALDLIVSTNQLAKKVVDEKTILVYPNTPEKQREHQDQVIRVFHLASADAKGAAAFLRSMLKIKEPFVDERTNMLALRESPETIQLAERLVAIYDGNEPEVMLELEVLEVGSTRLTELGLKFPDSIGFSILPPAGEDGLTVANLRRIGGDRVGVSLAGLLLSMRREVGDFEILANPRIRAKNKEKARVLIGDKFPVVTTTTSQTGFIAESVSYLDVGLKLDLEPVVYADDEVNIKVALEVSSLSSQLKTSTGLVAYQVKTRNASTTLRLRDGETQVLAGLISREQRSDANRVPGAGDMPVLGRLFSSQLDDGRRSELVLAVTPRVLRNLRRLDASEAELWVGTESYTRLKPVGQPSQAGVASAPAGRPMPARPAETEVQPKASVAATESPNASPPQPVPPMPPALRLSGPKEVRVGQEFSVYAALSASAPVHGVAMRLSMAGSSATVSQVAPGSFFRQDGDATELTQGRPTPQELQFGVRRKAASGMTGDGAAAEIRFRALRAGRLEIQVAEAEAFRGAAPAGAKGEPIAKPAPLVVEVKE
ncbi:secretin N-terminal domain-containing protein [Piscinibacter sp.]|uniref:secretin N-terminal domain-containing protein n=1 Tax=Piscinibacter sp. TaxID=1903157 RepID=UPI0011D345F6|nr:MAG: general secretion pathway protein GspD [Burkholderiaceae bacterium]